MPHRSTCYRAPQRDPCCSILINTSHTQTRALHWSNTNNARWMLGPERGDAREPPTLLRFVATLPESWPFAPAVINFVDPVVHPLVKGRHKLEHCLFKSNWSPMYTMSKVLLTARCDLSEPVRDLPLGLIDPRLQPLARAVRTRAIYLSSFSLMCKSSVHTCMRWSAASPCVGRACRV